MEIRDKTIQVCVTKTEKETMDKLALKNHMSLSEYVYRIIVEHIKKHIKSLGDS